MGRRGAEQVPRRCRGAGLTTFPRSGALAVARDKLNLDITWLRDESLEDSDNLPMPDVIAREIVEDLSAALVEFEAVATALESATAT